MLVLWLQGRNCPCLRSTNLLSSACISDTDLSWTKPGNGGDTNKCALYCRRQMRTQSPGGKQTMGTARQFLQCHPSLSGAKTELFWLVCNHQVSHFEWLWVKDRSIMQPACNEQVINMLVIKWQKTIATRSGITIYYFFYHHSGILTWMEYYVRANYTPLIEA